jgi:hypothetical protein
MSAILEPKPKKNEFIFAEKRPKIYKHDIFPHTAQLWNAEFAFAGATPVEQKVPEYIFSVYVKSL